MTTANGRVADYPVDVDFLKRWSPRAYDGTAVAVPELMVLFEAARWAPSSYNSQPWRFLYAVRDGADWTRFLGFLNPFNQSWAQHAGALVAIVSSRDMIPPGGSEVPSASHSFDAGAAWGYLALQASRLDLHAHAMVGLDFDAVRRELGVPERFAVECMVAIGRLGDSSILPEPLRARETPNARRPIGELAAAGDFANLGAGTGL